MEPVQVTHEEAATFGRPYVLTTVLHTKEHTRFLTIGESPVVIPRPLTAEQRDDHANVDN
jgi:hypothetical protein